MKHLFLFLILFPLFSCNSDKEIDYVALNDKEINDYLTDTNLVAQKSESGLYYLINEQGAGAKPIPTSNVTVVYKGYFTDGTIFDQSSADGISFNLQQVIKGWTEGITYFKAGGSGILLIPSHLAYGTKGRSGIPGGAVLIFDINLISVN